MMNIFIVNELHSHLGHIRDWPPPEVVRAVSSQRVLVMLKKHNSFIPAWRHSPCVHVPDIFNVQLIPAVIACYE